MNAQHHSIESGDTHPAKRRTYCAPRLQRLGRVSELTQNGGGGPADGTYLS